jgi:broad specificity phosphatase PhoE
MADTVWVVRHGERRDSVDPNWETDADRVHDPPLTDLGR